MAVQQQGIRRDQQDLEEHEQVEQVAGQEGTIDAEQLELIEGVKVGPALIITTAGIKRCETSQHRRHQQHQRAQPVQHENDAEWRLPATQRIDTQLAIIGKQHQPDRNRDQGPGCRQ